MINRYDINGMKTAMLQAYQADAKVLTRRMRAMRKTVTQHDVLACAREFMDELAKVGGSHDKPLRPARRT